MSPALPRLFRLSAPTLPELEKETEKFAANPAYLPEEPAQRYRRVVVAGDHADAVRRLGRGRAADVFTAEAGSPRPIVFMVTGIGDQYPGMASGLHHHLPVFRRELDNCLGVLEGDLGTGLRSVLYPTTPRSSGGGSSLADLFDLRDTTQEIHRTLIAQPLAFAIQYALARSLQSVGLTPAAMVGYSLGEYVVACLAGVFTLDDALHTVAIRAELMAAVPEGAMLAVMAEPDRLERHIKDGLAIASLDGPSLTVLTGTVEAIERAAARLMDEGIAVRRLATTHAFHSPVMEPIRGPLHRALSAIPLRPPATPFLSNLTGTWIRDEEATDPGYWTSQGLRTVRFADNLAEMWRLDRPVPIEVGAGRTLTNLANQHPGHGDLTLRTLPGLFESRTDLETLSMTIGTLWAIGLDISGGDPPWET